MITKPKVTNNSMQALQKENDALKKIISDQGIGSQTLDCLLSILELQRERIDFLDNGNTID